MRGRLGLAVTLLAVMLSLASCGGDDVRSSSEPAGEENVGGGGRLGYALSGIPGNLDPLLADTRSAELVTRQVHEPLVASLTGPFGDVRRRRGLAVSWASSGDRKIWRLRLRRGVRFQDGRPFNSSAVLVNGARWQAQAPGRELLPGLQALDAPRATLVRFIFRRPLRDLPRRLSSVKLGIVSPRTLRPRDPRRARLAATSETGTGPFELRERRGREGLVMARNAAWWGSRYRLGPALDQVDFLSVPPESERLELLLSGEAQVADELAPDAERRIARDPLLETIDAGRFTIGLERSVRGISSARVQPFSGVWLTRVGSGS